LINNVSDFNMRNRFLLLQKLEYIFIHKFEDEIELIFVLDEFVQVDDVGMMQFNENFYFVKIFTLLPIGVFLFHLFDSNNLTCLFIDSFDYATKAAISKDLSDFIFLHLNNQIVYK
jgi:hypothetical protein